MDGLSMDHKTLYASLLLHILLIVLFPLQIMIFIETELESSSEFDEDQRYSRSMELEPRSSKQTNKKHVSKTTSSPGD